MLTEINRLVSHTPSHEAAAHTNRDLYYRTARAFTGSTATDEASLLLTGQGQGQGQRQGQGHGHGQGLQHTETCYGRMKSVRELSISRAARHEISQLVIKNCTANINMTMTMKEEEKKMKEKNKEENEEKEKIKA